jgi:shikimate kinase
MNIVLIGYRGTGKSEVGAIVAGHLKMDCLSMDAEIVRRAGMKIPEIVEQYGWTRFRDMESQVARELSEKDNLVIDTGGGVIEREENTRALRKNGKVVWLTASVEVIVSRISSDTQRPPLVEGKTFTQEVAEVLAARKPKYKNAADHEIDTDHLTPDQVADQVVSLWRRQGGPAEKT